MKGSRGMTSSVCPEECWVEAITCGFCLDFIIRDANGKNMSFFVNRGFAAAG